MPTPIARILTILFAPYYLFVLVSVLMATNPNVDVLNAWIGVVVGIVAVCVLLACWSVKFVGEDFNNKRISLSSMMILTGILAIHLSYFRLLPMDFFSNGKFDFAVAIALTLQFILFSMFSIVVLTMFTATVLDIAVQFKRWLMNAFGSV